MKAEDLRYKNYITYKGKVFQVNDIFGASGLINVLPNGEDSWPGRLAVNDKDYAPIPLTEDWLIRFGFEKCEAKDVWDKLKLTWEDDLWWIPGMFFFEKDLDTWKLYQATDEDTYWMISSDVAHVHQLQNLYYCLCGSELTVTN